MSKTVIKVCEPVYMCFWRFPVSRTYLTRVLEIKLSNWQFVVNHARILSLLNQFLLWITPKTVTLKNLRWKYTPNGSWSVTTWELSVCRETTKHIVSAALSYREFFLLQHLLDITSVCMCIHKYIYKDTSWARVLFNCERCVCSLSAPAW